MVVKKSLNDLAAMRNQPTGPYEKRSTADLAELKELTKGNSKSLANALSGKDIQTGVFKWTPIGLQVDGPISREDWEYTGEMLQFVDSSIQWLIGDWLLAADELGYGDHEEFAENLGFKVGTIYQYAYVARKVEFSIRIENLTFGHHQAVAHLSTQEQQQWLSQAESGDWSIKTLREAISGKNDELSLTVYEQFSKALNVKKLAKLVDNASAADKKKIAAELRELADQIDS